MFRSGRPQKATIQVERLMKRKSTADSHKTTNDIAQELRQDNLTDVSRLTVSKRLHEVELFGRVAAKKPFISMKTRLPDVSLNN